MADKIKTVRQLKLVAKFADDDDRTLTVDNPRNDLTKDDFDDSTDFTKAAKIVLLGDKTGAVMSGWKTAKIYENTTTYLDLT